MDVSSQIQRGHTLTERNHEAIHHIVEQNETQTALLYATLANHQETSATIDKYVYSPSHCSTFWCQL